MRSRLFQMTQADLSRRAQHTLYDPQRGFNV